MVNVSIFSTHMQDLQEVTQEVHYENFRAERLANGTAPPKKTKCVKFFYNFSNMSMVKGLEYTFLSYFLRTYKG